MKKLSLMLTLAFCTTLAAQARPLPASSPYLWGNVTVVAGGFLTGIEFSPAQAGLLYAHIDIETGACV